MFINSKRKFSYYKSYFVIKYRNWVSVNFPWLIFHVSSKYNENFILSQNHKYKFKLYESFKWFSNGLLKINYPTNTYNWYNIYLYLHYNEVNCLKSEFWIINIKKLITIHNNVITSYNYNTNYSSLPYNVKTVESSIDCDYKMRPIILSIGVRWSSY